MVSHGVERGARVCPGSGVSYTICPMAEHPLAGTSPSKIIAVHVSYRSRAMERGSSSAVAVVLPQAAVHPGRRRRPGAPAAVVRAARLRGRGRARHRRPGPPGCPPADAWSHVRWVTAANDFGVYDLRYADRGANVRSKGIDGFTPIGPALLDARAIDPERITLRTWVNGELAQDAVSGDDLLFSFADIVADLSRLTTLEPGDVILTGTPTGSTVVHPGDLVEVEVSAAAAGSDGGGGSRGQCCRPAGCAPRSPRPTTSSARRARCRTPTTPSARPPTAAAAPPGPADPPADLLTRGRAGVHRDARLPAPQARLQPRHPRPAADDQAEPEDGRVRPDAALRAVPRGPVRPVRHHRRPQPG